MRENLGWAVGYNLLGDPRLRLASFYPVFGILLSPAIASAAMALSSVSVLANSLRLRGFQRPVVNWGWPSPMRILTRYILEEKSRPTP